MQPVNTIPDESARIAPPSATGNDGAGFEAKVGAYYLLAVLSSEEPRGLAPALDVMVRSGVVEARTLEARVFGVAVGSTV